MRYLLLIFCCTSSFFLFATNYYVHPELGKDNNTGTNVLNPFKNLSQISTLALKPGDAILLAASYTHKGMLSLQGQRGSSINPIKISSYQWGNRFADARATIDAASAEHGVYLLNCSHIVVEQIIIQAEGGSSGAAMRCGVLVTTDQAGLYENIQFQQLQIKDIFVEATGFNRGEKEVRTSNGTQRYGWGIRFINRTENAILKDLYVTDCIVENVAHTGIKFTGSSPQTIFNIHVSGNRVLRTGGPGIQMSRVKFGHVYRNYVQYSGSPDDSRKWGRGSGLWTSNTTEVVIEHNHFLDANGPADSAGCHVDHGCRDVVVQYNFSARNAGGFCEILGDNYNCAYRYNISVDDGHRVKGQNKAFQEGKTFWLSGYSGRKKPRVGPFDSYFYNNTIYVKKGIVSKIAVSKVADGVLIANNIFYVEGASKAVMGDQYVPEDTGIAAVRNINFQNNLYLKADYWPSDVWIQESSPIVGDPAFLQKGGDRLESYIPQNVALVKDKGISIPRIANDSIGLKIGLSVSHDILGNPIVGNPDLGAIEIR